MVNQYNSIVLIGIIENNEKIINNPGVFCFTIKIPDPKNDRWCYLTVKYHYEGNSYLPGRGDCIAVSGMLLFNADFDGLVGKSNFFYVDAKSITLLPKDSFDFHAEHKLSYIPQRHSFTLAGH